MEKGKTQTKGASVYWLRRNSPVARWDNRDGVSCHEINEDTSPWTTIIGRPTKLFKRYFSFDFKFGVFCYNIV